MKRKSVLRMGVILLSAGFMMGTVNRKMDRTVLAEEEPIIENRENTGNLAPGSASPQENAGGAAGLDELEILDAGEIIEEQTNAGDEPETPSGSLDGIEIVGEPEVMQEELAEVVLPQKSVFIPVSEFLPVEERKDTLTLNPYSEYYLLHFKSDSEIEYTIFFNQSLKEEDVALYRFDSKKNKVEDAAPVQDLVSFDEKGKVLSLRTEADADYVLAISHTEKYKELGYTSKLSDALPQETDAVVVQDVTEAQTEAETESEAQTEVQTEVLIETEGETETGSEVLTEAESESEAQTEIETEAESETEALTEAETESEVQTESESETEALTEAETESEVQTEGESETETLTEAETESEAQTESESETEALTEAETENEVQTESESETEAQTEAETESEAQTEGESETEALTEAETESEVQTENESETESEPMTETESEAETETETETESETEEATLASVVLKLDQDLETVPVEFLEYLDDMDVYSVTLVYSDGTEKMLDKADDRYELSVNWEDTDETESTLHRTYHATVKEISTEMEFEDAQSVNFGEEEPVAIKTEEMTTVLLEGKKWVMVQSVPEVTGRYAMNSNQGIEEMYYAADDGEIVRTEDAFTLQEGVTYKFLIQLN